MNVDETQKFFEKIKQRSARSISTSVINESYTPSTHSKYYNYYAEQ